MARAFTPGLQVTRSFRVKKVRELPVPGNILVKPGERVKADQVVAQASLPGELLILRIPEKLGIEAFEVIKNLKIKEGDKLTEEQLICEHVGLFGLFKSRYTAPVAGTVDFIANRTGHVGLRLAAQAVELNAYINGEVTEVQQGKSLTIEAEAGFVQGIFGVGGERFGVLHVARYRPRSYLNSR